jgi:hypothetical protein
MISNFDLVNHKSYLARFENLNFAIKNVVFHGHMDEEAMTTTIVMNPMCSYEVPFYRCRYFFLCLSLCFFGWK